MVEPACRGKTCFDDWDPLPFGAKAGYDYFNSR